MKPQRRSGGENSGPNPPREDTGPILVIRVEKLAPTGEGVARTPEGVGFVDRVLPGELVETSIYERRRRFWRGSPLRILEPSPDRIASAHAGCGGCDWSHYAETAAREAKRELFLETMQRIGHLAPELFGDPKPESPAASGAGYRLRLRLHVAGAGEAARIGYFAPGTHRVVDAASCEAIASSTRAGFPEMRDAIAESGIAASELAILEDLPGTRRLFRLTGAAEAAGAAGETRLVERLLSSFEGVRLESAEGALRLERGRGRLPLEVGGRSFRVSVDAFFQGNRHLVARLMADVREEAARVPPGTALDAFGGVGLFAGALLDAGHEVTSVERDREANEDARATRAEWADGGHWLTEAAPIADFLRADEREFDVVVADPPRAGLGAGLAEALARRARRLFLYVSCDPATLARDLAALRTPGSGLEISGTRLYDLFAFTHRVEALVALERRS
jgi:tRNA/tmRNA/rRNA uracil-C5-methylase (TrmA/RlmC/RlmD family)